MRFLPLDIPSFEHKQKVLDAFSGEVDFAYWREEELTVRDRTKPFHDPMPYTESALQRYPELLEYMQHHWPFRGIVYAKLIRANRSVDPHVDGNYVDDQGPAGNYNTISREFLNHQLSMEPCGYRMIINGNRKNLYLCDEYDPSYKRRDWTNINKRYCEIPDSTDCFLLRTNDSPHGVDSIDGDDNRLLLFAIGWLDAEKHHTLVERSMNMYGGLS